MDNHWWPLVSQARWFRGRGRDGHISQIHKLPWYTPQDVWPAIRSEIAQVSYPDGGEEFYQLIVAYRDAADPGTDIAQDADLLTLLWKSWHGLRREPASSLVRPSRLNGVDERSEEHSFDASLAPHWDEDLSPDLAAHPFTGEQSHSSVRFGDAVHAKFFRQLETNGEIVLFRTLAECQSRRVPRLYGSISADIPILGPADLAMIVESVGASHDGWDAAKQAVESGVSFAESARALGSDLRALHLELAEAFPSAMVPGRELVGVLAESAASVASDVETEKAAVLIRASTSLEWPPEAIQRIHSDLHLGQCLETAQGWVFVDFEGEPLRSQEGRRVDDSVWRDLAGMLRSFEYVPRAVDRDGPAIDAWVKECRQAFLDGYGLSSGMTKIGQLYELEKAIYEAAYEQKYRPEWQSIPLGAVTGIGLDVAAWVAQEQE